MPQAIKTANEERRYLSLAGAAQYTTLSIGTIRRLLRDGRLTGYRPSGRRVLIDRQELENAIAESAKPALRAATAAR
jgi:excisionase family DNA binding protein